ncbi:MAG: Gldg family protein [Ignavibacteriae bacterium]|nr:Gldg family protein [Ignavibacteriota bacterium]MCB9206000.1 Gldg family protein [Ignavibacteriales bacterium]MCB9257919.1 Gldg family protein [Ignavibacteriales bacterium]
MLTKRKVQTTLFLVIAIILLVNILSTRYFFRLDLTEDQRYSLSDATIDILENLDEPVTVTSYFSENLPPDIEKVRQDFKDLLIEYSNRSDAQVVYEFINPNEDQETEMKAQQSGISPIMINVRDKDQLKQQKAYLGALVQLGDKKEPIPFIQPGAAMEYALSTAIKKISMQDRPVLGLLQGHGEPSLSALQQLNAQLNVMYDIQTVTLSDTSGIPSNISSLAVIAPEDSVIDRDFNYLDEYLARGGRLLLAINNVKGNFQNASGEAVNTGFSNWLQKYGVSIEENFVLDANCSNVMVQQQQGFFRMNTPVSFPYLPIISKFTDHPITKGLETVLLPFASSINIAPKDTSISYVTLATSSEKSSLETLPLFFNIQKQWKNSDFGMSSIPVAVALEGKIAGTETKMVVFSDGDFATNGEGQGAQQLQPDNVSLMTNAIDWLSDDTGLIALRTKGVTSRPLDAQLEDGTKTLVKYANFLIPILLIVLFGAIRFQYKKKIRNIIKSTDYV